MASASWNTVGATLLAAGGLALFLSWSLGALGWPQVGFESAIVLSGAGLLFGAAGVFSGIIVLLIHRFSTARERR